MPNTSADHARIAAIINRYNDDPATKALFLELFRLTMKVTLRDEMKTADTDKAAADTERKVVKALDSFRETVRQAAKELRV